MSQVRNFCLSNPCLQHCNMFVCCFAYVHWLIVCWNDSDSIFIFRNVQTRVSTLQKKNPPQPPKTLTRVSLPVKASQLTKLNPMSYIFTFLISCIYYSCIITFGLGILQLYQDKPHIPYTFPGTPSQNNLGGYVYCSVIVPSTCTCRTAVLLDRSCPDQPHAYTYARPVAMLDIWLAPYKWPRGCTFL